MIFEDAREVKLHLIMLRLASLSWREIAARPPFSEIGIPAGSLSSIYKTGEIPAKWQYALLGRTTQALANVCPIHGIVETYNCQAQQVVTKRKRAARTYSDLFSMPSKVLRQALIEREIM